MSVPSNHSCCLPVPPLCHPKAIMVKAGAKAAASKAVESKLLKSQQVAKTLGNQAVGFRNLIRYRTSAQCKKAGTVLGSQGLNMHIAKMKWILMGHLALCHQGSLLGGTQAFLVCMFAYRYIYTWHTYTYIYIYPYNMCVWFHYMFLGLTRQQMQRGLRQRMHWRSTTPWQMMSSDRGSHIHTCTLTSHMCVYIYIYIYMQI